MKILSNADYQRLLDDHNRFSRENWTLNQEAAQLRKELALLRTRMTEINLRVALETGREVVHIPEKIIPARVEPAHVELRKVKR